MWKYRKSCIFMLLKIATCLRFRHKEKAVTWSSLGPHWIIYKRKTAKWTPFFEVTDFRTGTLVERKLRLDGRQRFLHCHKYAISGLQGRSCKNVLKCKIGINLRSWSFDERCIRCKSNLLITSFQIHYKKCICLLLVYSSYVGYDSLSIRITLSDSANCHQMCSTLCVNQLLRTCMGAFQLSLHLGLKSSFIFWVDWSLHSQLQVSAHIYCRYYHHWYERESPAHLLRV